MRAVALRYALAPACVVVAVLLYRSPVGPTFSLAGLFVFAVLAAAWFGGAGPGLVAALLATLVVPQLVKVSYPLLGGFLDVPRLITFSIEGIAVGWWSFRRRQVEAALRESERRYALAMEAAGDGHTDWDLVTGEFYISPRLLEIVGHPPDTSFADRADWVRRFPFYPPDRLKWEVALAAHMAGRESHFKMELRIVVRGEVRWTVFHFLSTRDAAGKPIRWTGSIGDITEQKRAEEALRASEERSSLAMEAAEEGYVDADVDTDQFVTSERLNEIFGIPPGTRFADRRDFLKHFRFYGDDAKIYGDMIRAVSTQGGPNRYEFEFRIVLPSGEVRWLWTRGKVTRDAEGRTRRRVGVVADITARKLAEEGLRTSEERFALAVAGSLDGLWDIDFVASTVYFSARTRELCGLPPGPEVVPLAGWFEALPLHPDDWPIRTAAMHAHLSGKAPVYEGEWRLLQPDGVYRWRHLHGVCVRDADGKPLRMAGSMSDVDARRRAQDALRESEERYERVVAATEAGFWDWDVVQDQYYVSPRLIEMAGLPPGTILAGRADFQARVPWHPEDLERWQRELQALFASGGSRLSTELRVILGSVTYWYRLDGMCFRNSAGDVVRWTGSAIDVTDRKLAEEALRASEQRYSLAMEGSQEGHFDVDLDTDEFFTSERINEMYGLPPGTRFANRAGYLAVLCLHRDDVDRYHATLAAVMANDGPERFDFEYRIVRPSG
jgi:PAS domain S-box-containing protein